MISSRGEFIPFSILITGVNCKSFIKLAPDYGQLNNPCARDTINYKEILLTV